MILWVYIYVHIEKEPAESHVYWYNKQSIKAVHRGNLG